MIVIPADGQIAVVDDSKVERMILSRVLEMSNLVNPVIEFSSAVSFLNEIDGREQSDLGLSLVLMDINMPVMTGFEALPQIRVERQMENLKIAIMVSSFEARSDISRAEELGADGYIAKQAGIDKFVAEINANFSNEPAY
ncbi:MAG: response regulator [Acidimicrobiales bacterium]|nr:response regulator [Acidimicrobiia bacterium]NNF53980.1 response regulator [Acidimicrobiales bacterium]